MWRRWHERRGANWASMAFSREQFLGREVQLATGSIDLDTEEDRALGQVVKLFHRKGNAQASADAKDPVQIRPARVRVRGDPS